MAVSVVASAETVDKKPAVSELTNGGKYYIYDANTSQNRFSFFRDMNADALERISGNRINVANAYGQLPEANYVWTATQNEAGKWEFQNVATGHYFGNSNSASETPGSFELTAQSAPNVFSVKNVSNGLCWDADVPTSTTSGLSYWYAPGHPIMFFAAVENNGTWNFDATVNYQVAVNIKYNGTTINTQNFSGTAGTQYTITLPAFTATTEELTRTFTADATIDVNVEQVLPFRVSTVENPVWQAWFMHATYQGLDTRFSLSYITNDEETNVTGFRNNITTTHPDAEQWAFVGDIATGFKIYNKVAGMGMALKNNSPMATLVPAEEATLWTIAPSAVAACADQTKYWVFRANNTCANMQWKNGNGVIKYWAAADQGSTCWVEGVSQPIVNQYAGATFNTTRPSINGVVGDYLDEATAEATIAKAQQGQTLVAALDPWNEITADQLSAIDAIKAEVENAPRVAFEPEKCCYRLYSFQYNGYMVLNEQNNVVGQGSADHAAGLVSFLPAPTEGKYYMQINNKLFTPVTISAQVGTVDTTEGAGEYTVSTVGAPFQFVFKGGNDNYNYLHEAGAHNIVGWETAAPSTKWYLVPTQVPTGIEEVATESVKDATIYDLQGRRVAAPAAGIYIINRRKVAVK